MELSDFASTCDVFIPADLGDPSARLFHSVDETRF